MTMRVIFVNRFYWPETPATGQLLTDLAEALAIRGHDVSVITSRGTDPAIPARQQQSGVDIRRIRSTRSRGAGAAGKAIDFATFYLGAAWRLWRVARRGDVIVALTDPPLIGIAAWLIARMRGARMVHWVQDIYPEVAIELGAPRWLRAVRPLRDRSWANADLCVTLGTEMAAVVANSGIRPVKLVVIPNWSPAGLVPPATADITALRRAWGLDGKFVVGYSGNLGRVHDLEAVLRVAEALRDDGAIQFVFIGTGAQRDALQAATAARGLSNAKFIPSQPRAQLASTLGVADVHLVTLKPGCERLVFPSKLYGIAAAEKPMVFIGPVESEIARIISSEGLGHVGSPDDVQEIAAHLRALAKAKPDIAAVDRARKFAAAHTAEAGTRRWAALLEALQAC